MTTRSMHPPNASSRPAILLVEDDVRLAELVRGYLENNGFSVTVEGRGETVVELAQRRAPDMIVLDLGLPGQDGLSVCKALRPNFANPVLILTARDNDIDHVLGLELGADDYVVKPVDPRVLLARINALLRRGKRSNDQERKPLRFGSLAIDASARSVLLDERAVSLSSNEFDLLYCLAARAGQIQSRESLYRVLYHREYDGLDRTLDVRISHLRRKLGDDAENSERIKTVWGQGYLFVPTAW